MEALEQTKNDEERMKKITAYQVPALLNAHPGLTALAVFENNEDRRFEPNKFDDAIRNALHAQATATFNRPFNTRLSHDEIFVNDVIFASASSYLDDDDGLLITKHIAGFIYQHRWNNRGKPPIDVQIECQFRMMLHKRTKAFIAVLADKQIYYFIVEKDLATQERITAALTAFSLNVQNNTPPPIDVPAPETISTVANELAATNTNEIASAWLKIREQRNEALTAVKHIEARFDAHKTELCRRIPPGEHIDVSQTRIIHHATNGSLKTESLNNDFF